MTRKSSLNKKASSIKNSAKKLSPSRRNSSSTNHAQDGSAKLHTNLSTSTKSTYRAKKDAKARKKAEHLAGLPKSRTKRMMYRLNPKRMKEYWFSKEGGIMALKVAGIGLAVMILFMLSVFAFFRRGLPPSSEINNRVLSQTTKFYDRTGEHLLFELYGAQNRSIVKFDEISDYAKWATVSIEDKDFYKHGGFSLTGITRAAFSNFTGGQVQGGSTITQQFIKNSLLTNEQTITRKVKELILAIELERLYEKDEILSFYLNEIPYGAQEYGIQAASQSFFNKSAKDLNIAESAMLAALPQAPSLYSPYSGNSDALIDRSHTIIDAMADQGYISQEEADEAKKDDVLARIVPIENKSLYRDINAPHFVLEIVKQLNAEFTETIVQTNGLKVITTLDWELQKIAEESVKNNMDQVTNPLGSASGGDNAALVATDNQTGQVLAYVGSRDFNYPGYGAFDAASPDVGRQPGSSFKPFGYAELFKNDRWGPDSIIYDTPTTFSEYAPKNFDFGYKGMQTVRQALGESRNIPAVKALYIAGVENTVNLAKSMGNESLGDPTQYGLSLVLGAGEVKLSEHTHAYSTFARGGVQKEQAYVLKVENSNGEVLKEWQDTEGEQVLDKQIAYLITDALSDDTARSGTFGRNNKNLVVPGVTHAVKTGTTDQSVDGWMMGYSKYITTGTWVGNHDSKPMNTITSNQNGPIFTEFMRRAHEEVLFGQRKLADAPIFDAVPEGIQQVRMNRSTGYAAQNEGGNTYIGKFPSWYKPQYPQGSGIEVVIDTISNKKATSCTPERAKKVATGGGKWPELMPDDPFFYSWAASAGYSASGAITQEDDIHKCNDAKPRVSLSTSDIGGGKYRFTAQVTKGTHPLDTLNFKVDGQIVSAQKAGSSGTYTYDHTFSKNGASKITAEVIDSVLYEDSNTKSLNVTGVSSGSFSITSTSINGGNGNVEVSWTGGTGPYEILVNGSSAGTSGSKSFTIDDNFFPSNGSYTITVKGSNGQSTDKTINYNN
jgi:penicillin-binding protein 1A